MFDTGSANSWVLSADAGDDMTDSRRSKHNFYNNELSATYDEPTVK